jgi:hypothetical protein
MKRLGIITALLTGLTAVFASVALAVTPGVYSATFDYTQAPGGTHLVTPTTEADVTCTVSASLSVTCPTTNFDIAGVGHTNATELLSTVYSATIDCRNNGGQVVESHTQSASVTAGPTTLRAKNGRLTTQTQTAVAPTDAQLQSQATCPNPNWTAEVRPGTKVLSSFTWTIKFDGFSGAFITISASDP